MLNTIVSYTWTSAALLITVTVHHYYGLWAPNTVRADSVIITAGK